MEVRLLFCQLITHSISFWLVPLTHAACAQLVFAVSRRSWQIIVKRNLTRIEANSASDLLASRKWLNYVFRQKMLAMEAIISLTELKSIQAVRRLSEEAFVRSRALNAH
jgi:hypothetical protein